MSEEPLNAGIEGLENTGESTSNPTQTGQDTPTSTSSNSSVPDFLAKESPKKDIDPHYINHQLNFRSSEGMGRTIRGLEGALGSLNYWPLDVVVGISMELWDMVTEKDGKSSKPDSVEEE